METTIPLLPSKRELMCWELHDLLKARHTLFEYSLSKTGEEIDYIKKLEKVLDKVINYKTLLNTHTKGKHLC